MRKYKQSELKRLVASGAAECVNTWSFEQINTLYHTTRLDRVGYSSGVYGLNGGLLQDLDTGKLYAVTARNSALFQLM